MRQAIIALEAEEALNARQHRISRRRGEKRCRDEEEESDSDESSHRTIPLSAIKGIKKQARYEPVIPMSKTELSKWRKEARRVRNRESAAASRRKTRDRIEELESQVNDLESKYSSALKRIAELESTAPTVSPTLSPKSVLNTTLPAWSLSSQDAAFSLAKSTEYGNNLVESQAVAPSFSHQHHQQPNLMISRPTAVCVTESTPLIIIPSSSEDLGS